MHRHGLGQFSGLLQREIPVVETRSMEELSVCIAELSQGAGLESIGVEEQIRSSVGSRQSWILSRQPALEIGNIRGSAVYKRSVFSLTDEDWKTRGKAGDARNTPSLRQAFWSFRKGSIERDEVVVAENKVVGQIVV